MSEAARTTLLSVDDEPNICRALKRTLRRLNLQVLVADSGAAGLQTMKENHVDIVISDMRMPQMSGAEFLAEVAREYPDTKRVLLTGYSDIESTVAAINEGRIATYLTKPWDEERLLDVIGDLIEQVNLRNDKLRLERLTELQNEKLQKLNDELEARVTRRTEALSSSRDMLQSAIDELQESYQTMVGLLASVVELRDPDGAADTPRKKTLALAMANHLGLNEEDCAALSAAVDLHRIGRMALDDKTLRTPLAQLTEEQRSRHEQHPAFAEGLLMGVAKLNPAAALIRDQHEQVGGGGFPSGKAGTNIPPAAGCLALARDYYDLMSGRLEARSLSSAEALMYIHEATGKRYAADVVAAFKAVLKDIQAEVPEVRELLVEARLLQPGMILARQLMTPSGVMLLPAGHRLNEAVISKIVRLEETVAQTLSVHIRPPEH